MSHVLRSRDDGGMGYDCEDVFMFGRSIGTGPACLLAKEYKPRGLILMSPYTTIKSVAKTLYGNFFGNLCHDHFDNEEAMKDITCAVLLIHGLKDELIPCDHSCALIKILLT